MKCLTTFIAAAALLAISATANAAAITGSFSIAGPVTSNNPGVTIDQANSITFTAVNTYVPGTGVLGSLPACNGSCGTGGTLNLTNMVSPYTFTASNPLFTLTNGLSFSLTSITNETRTSAAAGGGIPTMSVFGTILLSLAGYTSTPGTFAITTQGVDTTVTFSASGLATAVPEPASLAIVGGSLAALGLIRRRRAK